MVATDKFKQYKVMKRRNHSHPQELPMFAEIKDLLALISSFTTLVMVLISRHDFYYIYISRWYLMQNEFFAKSSSFHLKELDQYFYYVKKVPLFECIIKSNYYFDPNQYQDHFICTCLYPLFKINSQKWWIIITYFCLNEPFISLFKMYVYDGLKHLCSN